MYLQTRFGRASASQLQLPTSISAPVSTHSLGVWNGALNINVLFVSLSLLYYVYGAHSTHSTGDVE